MASYRVLSRAFTGADWSPSNTLVDAGDVVEVPGHSGPLGSAYEEIVEEAAAPRARKAAPATEQPAESLA